MTLKEFCEKYYYSEVTVLNAFPQVQRSILKKYGVLIEKQGRGKKANYIDIRKGFNKRKIFISKELDYTFIEILDSDNIIDKESDLFKFDYFNKKSLSQNIRKG